MIENVLLIALIAVVIVVVSLAWAHDMGDAIDRRRAWNLWLAGIIDDEELRRRVDR